MQKERFALVKKDDLDKYEQKLQASKEEKEKEAHNIEKRVNELQTQKKAKEEEILKKQNELKNLETKLQTLQIDKTIKELSQKIDQQKEEKDALLQAIGSLEQTLKKDEEDSKRYKEYKNAIDDIKEELEYWRLLNDLIGSADGAKFVKYAQGITFDNLIRLANKHLGYMSDRYQLKRLKSDNDLLDFVIIDSYNANEERPIQTLSGGESFLVSLSLALGLADLASKRVSIDSLFLDEGFGTLDSQTLDTVLDALSKLQNRGKIIGLISHVAALQEAIPKKIKVEIVGAGFSKISHD